MKRSYLLGSLLVIPALVLFLASVPGCTKTDKGGKEGTASKENVSKEGTKEGDGGSKKAEAVVAKADGSLKGKVIYDGTPPDRPPLPMKGHADEKVCMAGPHLDQKWIVSKEHGVANVVVYLEAPEGKFFAVDEKIVKEQKPEVVIDQPHCVYEPHVVALFPVWRDADNKQHKDGQKLLVKNSSAGISHNTKITADKGVIFNAVQFDPKGDAVDKLTFSQGPKKPVDVSCDKHTWMNAKILTFDHPFFAVTDEKGDFEIKHVPTGVPVTVKYWHEDIGIKDAAKDQTFKAAENDLPEIKVKAKAAS
jgi:hypothetical protein